MKKRILSILLTLCMVISLVPATAFAADGVKSIQSGTGAQSALKVDQSKLSFAGHAWWVISKKTDEGNNAPIVTLLAADNDFGTVAFRAGSDGPSENTSRYSEDNGYYANNPAGMAHWKKPNEYAGSTLQQKMASLAEEIPEKERAVIRPKDIDSGITGQAIKGQKLWALAHVDCTYLLTNESKYDEQWWTRSSNAVYGYGSWTLHPDGRSGSALNIDYTAAVRPALDLDLSSVVFISAAEHGKVADLATPIAEYTGNDWKLTLQDSSRDDFTAKTVSVNGSVLDVEYDHAKVGEHEYISAIIQDADGNISNYARIAQLNGTLNGSRGQVRIDLSGIDMTGKTLCVFNEQYNGDDQTDYASALRAVKLTAQVDEQFSLTPGGRYYFDLSGVDMPGEPNSGSDSGVAALPDTSLHYVPFTYVGTVNAYALKSKDDTNTRSYEHSLFIADYNVMHNIFWNALNGKGVIYGKDYASGGIDYTLRAPSAGSNSSGSGNTKQGTPANNEWDAILDKAGQGNKDDQTGYIKNWSRIFSWGQDLYTGESGACANRGFNSARYYYGRNAAVSGKDIGYRPVLELPTDLAADSLKVVELHLGANMPGENSDVIQMIVKNGRDFTAPATEGLPRPDSLPADMSLGWTDESGNCYAPGDTVPAGVSKLFVTGGYSVTYQPGAYGTGDTVTSIKFVDNALTLRGALFTREGYTQTGWAAIDGGEKVYGLAAVYTENQPLTLYPVWTENQYTVTFDGNGGRVPQETMTVTYGEELDQMPIPRYKGYFFRGWYDQKWGGKPYSDENGHSMTRYDKAGDCTLYAMWEEAPLCTVTFDPNGGTLTGPATCQEKQKECIPRPDEEPVREGYNFTGWYRDAACTQRWDFDDPIPGNMTLYAGWQILSYVIRVQPANGEQDIIIDQDYGTPVTPPTLTRTGYTFIGWDQEFPATMPAKILTITALWKVNAYTITFDTVGGSQIAPITQDYGTAVTAPAAPTKPGYAFAGWDPTIPTTMPAENRTITAQWRDIEKPTGEIKISENSWKTLLNTITFGLFFKDTQTVTVTADDNSGQPVKVEYLLSDRALTGEELESGAFAAYTEPLHLNPDNAYVIYARLTDTADNVTYICSDGIVLDGTAPVISGVENGRTYCAAQTVTVSDPYLDTVTLNGTPVMPDANGGFVLSPAQGAQTIVATDKAGNTATVTVTINHGHTFAEWTPNGDGTHSRKCTVDGCGALETADCSGGKATCKAPAVCTVCGASYGALDPANHTRLKHFPAKAATKTATGNTEYWYCADCGKYFADAAATKEIKQADTITAKLPSTTQPTSAKKTSGTAKSPHTGWDGGVLSALLLSGGACVLLTFYRKKRTDT